MTRPRIAISLGDPAGIGPEIALKAALDPRVHAVCDPVLVGSREAVAWHSQACGISVPLREIALDGRTQPTAGTVDFVALDQFRQDPLEPGEVRPAHGRAAVEAARVAIEAALAGTVDAVVACPQTEAAIHQAGIEFDGYPSFVARCTGTPLDDAYLMLCFDKLRIIHATLHVSLARAIALTTRARLLRVLTATHETLARLLGHDRPTIAVAGLNPHASEGGLFGEEEASIIAPAIQAARDLGIAADGPFGADTMFVRDGYDAFVVLYHDQGHIAAKLMAPHRIAGLTIGTPILFSSVAHGSALDLAGRNAANPEAVVEAVLRLAAGAGRARLSPAA